MFHHRQQFNVGKLHAVHILRQERREFPVTQPPVAITHPRTQMNFINRNGRLQAVLLSAMLHPIAIIPGIAQVPHFGCRARRLLMAKTIGVSLVYRVPMLCRRDVVLVESALPYLGNEGLPDARVVQHLHCMSRRIPAIETADDRYNVSIRRPNGK